MERKVVVKLMGVSGAERLQQADYPTLSEYASLVRACEGAAFLQRALRRIPERILRRALRR